MGGTTVDASAVQRLQALPTNTADERLEAATQLAAFLIPGATLEPGRQPPLLEHLATRLKR